MNLKEITQTLKAKQYKLTPQRIAIIKIMLEVNHPLSALDVFQKVKVYHSNISLDTVYRSLHLLAAIGVVSLINIANRERELFELAQHHHHLVCTKCGQVICMESILMEHDTIMQQAATTENFQVTGHAFEVYGFCSNCH
ncbi:MAG: Fur family transcriptional regulator [Bacillota bacterium]|nr:Fur family transcriptional regulator [Bacillota bacterium]